MNRTPTNPDDDRICSELDGEPISLAMPRKSFVFSTPSGGSLHRLWAMQREDPEKMRAWEVVAWDEVKEAVTGQVLPMPTQGQWVTLRGIEFKVTQIIESSGVAYLQPRGYDWDRQIDLNRLRTLMAEETAP